MTLTPNSNITLHGFCLAHSLDGYTMADVFNVFNRQTAAVIDETREVSYDPSTILPTYGRVISYTAPRTFRLTAEYNF